jgi:hypothetical protein
MLVFPWRAHLVLSEYIKIKLKTPVRPSVRTLEIRYKSPIFSAEIDLSVNLICLYRHVGA